MSAQEIDVFPSCRCGDGTHRTTDELVRCVSFQKLEWIRDDRRELEWAEMASYGVRWCWTSRCRGGFSLYATEGRARKAAKQGWHLCPAKGECTQDHVVFVVPDGRLAGGPGRAA